VIVFPHTEHLVTASLICDIIVMALGNWRSPMGLVGTRTSLIFSPSFVVTVAVS